jgi:hypothetical protein
MVTATGTAVTTNAGTSLNFGSVAIAAHQQGFSALSTVSARRTLIKDMSIWSGLR